MILAMPEAKDKVGSTRLSTRPSYFLDLVWMYLCTSTDSTLTAITDEMCKIYTKITIKSGVSVP
jgi:hypothetical protein